MDAQGQDLYCDTDSIWTQWHEFQRPSKSSEVHVGTLNDARSNRLLHVHSDCLFLVVALELLCAYCMRRTQWANQEGRDRV